ncbi:hypothetical protein SAMD00019534_049430 [Acytostelium subglobosum LB1]|uniref:hypothetical protein n=1 Tax=Acytostelium subglobosum LB1 TaxID=1410327 RepID=UPI000644B4A6|nr:hypothetical protein SAMD00019534_049430 [Acytostelium subglobosum LB1]GAM21768.1 hypothetical protein SAMD00019534_049430 [Acytostelium subglobosum LB1]|eukprot:XP_012754868.1 hypothetical protein SAMD00019534_049430 [Acytostelium subglobosum LB1]
MRSTEALISPAKSPNVTGCATRTSCSDCTSDTDCVWCHSAAKCTSGSFYGSNPLDTCRDFMWMQCNMKGIYTLLISAGILLVIILFFIALICCCCRRRKTVIYNNTYTIQDDEAKNLISSTPVTDQRREQMRMKYGVGSYQNSSSSWN